MRLPPPKRYTRTGGNWVSDDFLADFRTEAETHPDFVKAVWPNSAIQFKVDDV